MNKLKIRFLKWRIYRIKRKWYSVEYIDRPKFDKTMDRVNIYEYIINTLETREYMHELRETGEVEL